MDQNRVNQLRNFLKETPNDPFLHYALALEFQKSDASLAAEKYHEILNDYPDYLPAYYHAAHLFWEQEDYVSAEKTFEIGIRLARQVDDKNTLRELQNAYQNFQFDT